MAERHDDFYIGYKPQASATVRSWVRKVVAALFALAVVVPVILASAQHEFADSYFEFATVKEFEGRLDGRGHPVLHVDEQGATAPHLLVEVGKRGVRAGLEELHDRQVRLTGKLIYRGDRKMVELTADEPVSLGERLSDAGDTTASLGRHSLTGEILDSKCYLGVMKPGRGKPHRDCAVRCISGGVPPLFVVTDRAGNELHLLLVGEGDEPIGRELLHLVAEPVAVEGELVARGGLWYLRASADGFERLGGAGG